jgi:putative transposase
VIKAEDARAVDESFIEHHGSFGRRMLKKILAGKGIYISEQKVSRIMKYLGLCAKYGRRKCENIHTSKTGKKYIQENIFAKLSAEEREKMEIWSMDFTEEKIQGKKVYTCGIISVNSKILVGYAQGKRCTSELALEAVSKALSEYGLPDMIMTDRGAQFVGNEFRYMIENLGIIHSMSRPYKPIDNRFIETFWKSMKVELGKVNHLTQETYRMVVEYYIYYYNNLRPHSTLNYRTPLAA